VCECVSVYVHTYTLQNSLAVFSRVISLFFLFVTKLCDKTATYHCNTYRNATLLGLFYRCCSVLQCFAMYGSDVLQFCVLQCVAVCVYGIEMLY